MSCNDQHDENCKFHHVQFYVSSLQPTSYYKELEKDLNELAGKGSYDPFSGGMRFLGPEALPTRVQEGREKWCEFAKHLKDPEKYSSVGQDLAEQLIVGAGWRVTGEYVGKSTRSLLLCSDDPCGKKMVVTTKHEKTADAEEPYFHFRAQNVEAFYKAHADRDGCGVLAFEVDVGTLDNTFAKYKRMHPSLLASPSVSEYKDTRTVVVDGKTTTIENGTFRSLEVFGYYLPGTKDADKGTILRFSERTGAFAHTPGFGNPQGVLPGLVDVPAKFDGTSIAAYSDHWVSNVVDREGFLQILEDTLGFTPKVDFNAGVVAAGEAIIESTVTGNTSGLNTDDLDVAFQDQSQVYLPINNALSHVGHVAHYIEEMGQGIQHLACRVKDLTGFIERVNNYRKITGQGFTFLRIPRSYYGRLATATLVKEAGVSQATADAVFDVLQKKGLMTPAGVVDMEITPDTVKELDIAADDFKANAAKVAELVLRSRYENMYSLLRDNISAKTYVQIVQNQVLVDIQGKDILFQIFTSNICQKKAGVQAPFLEFIQRVCSASQAGVKIRPGCGGFGIRNFLTLFLSIEVSKAMLDAEEGAKVNDAAKVTKANKVVEALTAQLDESNPILTMISDAMTEEADELDAATTATDAAEKAKHAARAEECRKLKEKGNDDLKVCSDKYKAMLKAIRES